MVSTRATTQNPPREAREPSILIRQSREENAVAYSLNRKHTERLSVAICKNGFTAVPTQEIQSIAVREQTNLLSALATNLRFLVAQLLFQQDARNTRFTLEQQSLVIVSDEQLSVKEITQLIRGGWELSNDVDFVMGSLIITSIPNAHVIAIGRD